MAHLKNQKIVNSNSSDSDSDSFCLPINATESTTASNCNCFTQVYGYMNGGTSQTEKEEKTVYG